MKQAYIKYQNFGRNLKGKFNIFSDKGSGIPNELYSSDLMRGSIINVHDDATKIHIIPKIYNLVASGNSQASGLKFYLTNPSGIYNSEDDQYYLHQTSFPLFSGTPNFTLSEFGLINETGLQGNIEINKYQNFGSYLAIPTKIVSGNNTIGGNVKIYKAPYYYLVSNIQKTGSTFGSIIHMTNNLVFIGDFNNQLNIYKRDFYNDSFRLTQTLNITSGSNNYNLSSNIDGSVFIVGTPLNSIGGYGAGMINIYSGDPGSVVATGLISRWLLKQSITGSGAISPQRNDFGRLTAISNSGNILAASVGTQFVDIYTGSKQSKWVKTDTITYTESFQIGNLKFNNFNDLIVNKNIYTGIKGKYLLKYVLSTNNSDQQIASINFNSDCSIIAAHVQGRFNQADEYVCIYTGSREFGWAKKYQHSKNFPVIGGYEKIKNVLMNEDTSNLFVHISTGGNNNYILAYNNNPLEASLATGYGISKFENNDYPKMFLMTGAGADYINGTYTKIGMLNNKPMYSGLTSKTLLRYGLNDYEKQSYISYSIATGAYYFRINNTSFPNLSGAQFYRLNETLNSNPYYNSTFGSYALWRTTGSSLTGIYTNPTWTISITSNTGNLTSARFVKSNTGISITGLYTGLNGWSGQFNLINSTGIINYAFPVTGNYPKQWYLSEIFDIEVSGVPQWRSHPDDYYYLTGDIDIKNISTGNWTYDGPGAIQGPPPKFFPIYNDAFSKNITGLYSTNGANLTGNVVVEPLAPKLHVFNTPGITGFAGTYTSGTYTIGGIPRTAFKKETITLIGGYANTQYFYIYKNNLPSEWRAVEDLYNGPYTWYTNLNGNDNLPPTTGWLLGGGDKQPYINPIYGPAPEINFGTCPGTTLVYPDYVFQAFSSAPELNKTEFYSGGYINNDGTSSLFPENTNIKDIFPDIEYTFFHKNYYYSDFINGGRYYLFCALDNADSNKWLLAKSPRNFTTGYYYWKSDHSYINYTGTDTLQTARKVYYPVGTAVNKNTVSIDVNRKYINNTLYVENLDISNYSGFIHLRHIPKESFNEFIKSGNFVQSLGSNSTRFVSEFSGITNINKLYVGWSGNDYFINLDNGSPIEITISGVKSGQLPRTIKWFSTISSGNKPANNLWSNFDLYYKGTDLKTGKFEPNGSFVQKFTGYLPNFNNILIMVPESENIFDQSVGSYVYNDTNQTGDKFWRGVDMSDDGQIQVAVATNTPIKMSYDYGLTWSDVAGDRNWTSVTMSKDGKYISANSIGGITLKSSNSGQNWSTVFYGNNQYSRCIAMSDDGKVQTIPLYSSQFGILVSTNFGSSFSQKIYTNNWRDVCMSSDGKIQAATASNTATDPGEIWMSFNSGNSWAPTSAPSNAWDRIAMSSGGKYLSATIDGGPIWISNDSGQNWTPKISNSWKSLAMSKNGQYQTATSSTGIWNSYNFGETWNRNTGFSNMGTDVYWGQGAAMSSDGTRQTLLANPGIIWRSYVTGLSPASIYITVSGDYGFYRERGYKISTLKSFDGLYEFKIGNSGKYSGLRYFQNENFILANPLFKITGARCFDSGTNIWSILDTGYNYTNWKNCESRSSQFPSQFWVSGSGGSNESIDFKTIPLYSYNVNYATGLYLTYNTGYNYSAVSGIYNLSKNQIFNFTGNRPMSGIVIHSTGNSIYGCLLDNNGTELSSSSFSAYRINGASTISITDINKNIYYEITQSGNKVLYTTSYYSRTFWICK